MHFSLGQALVGLLAVFSVVPSALGTPTDIANVTGSSANISSTFVTRITTATTATTTPSPHLVERWSPAPSNLACYNRRKDCKQKDIWQSNARKWATAICGGKRFKGVVAEPGWEGTAGWIRNPYFWSYNIKVEWKDGCTAPGNGKMKIDTPAPGITCADLTYSAWKNCNNGGRGGKVDFGCLTYYYNTINGDEVGNEFCMDVPFGNWTR